MNTLKIFAAIILVALVINGCDKVQTYTPKAVIVVDTTTTITSTITDSSTVRNVLVEDYSGHHCGNCPAAAVELDTLISDYGQKIVPVNVQAGGFATYLNAPYTADFTTSVGNSWDQTFGISVIGNPAGMVDRHEGPSPLYYWAPPGTWADSVALILPQPNAANIKITNVYRASSRSLTTTVTSNFLKDSLSSTYMLSVIVTEDSIINYQLNYSANPEDVPNYVFNHMLKASFNGPWGDTLAVAPAKNTSFTKTYSLALGTSINSSGTPNILVDKHCHVVAFIYDVATNAVIQAEEDWVTQ